MPDTTSRAMSILEKTGAVKSGHFVLSSGLHSPRYCQCAALFEDPRNGEAMARMLVEQLPRDLNVNVVLAPALGGVLWGYDVARALGCRSYFAERQTGQPFEIRRSFALQPGERVLLAEDVVTTGGSVSELVPLVEKAGAKVVAFAAVADRSRGAFKPVVAGMPVPFYSLAQLDFPTYDPAACPLCKEGSPAVKPGSRTANKS